MTSRRRRCRSPDRRREAGFTLVEVVVASLVSAMMITSFFSIALTSRMQTGRSNRKLAASQQAARVLEKLRGYVADPTVYNTGYLQLPNAGKLPGDASGVWALTPGLHDVSSLLNTDPNFNGLPTFSMQYCVAAPGKDYTSYNCPGFPAGVCPSLSYNNLAFGGSCVEVQVNWTEPNG